MQLTPTAHVKSLLLAVSPDATLGCPNSKQSVFFCSWSLNLPLPAPITRRLPPTALRHPSSIPQSLVNDPKIARNHSPWQYFLVRNLMQTPRRTHLCKETCICRRGRQGESSFQFRLVDFRQFLGNTTRRRARSSA